MYFISIYSFCIICQVIYASNQTYISFFVDDTSVTLMWPADQSWSDSSNSTLKSPYNYPRAYEFEIEMAWPTAASLDFLTCGFVQVNPTLSTSTMINTTIFNLNSSTLYGFRVIPLYDSTRGATSPTSFILTSKTPVSYWELILAKADPIVQDFSPSFPSARQGHSLNLIKDDLYLFGGRVDGSTCASSFIDMANLGIINSGISTYPCVLDSSEVSELWTLNIQTLQWKLISHKDIGIYPSPREMHATIAINGALFLFGGRQRKFQRNQSGNFILEPHNDIIFSDMYMLEVAGATELSVSWIPKGSESVISLEERLFCEVNVTYNSTIESANLFGLHPENICVDDISIEINLFHECLQQIRISLQGPSAMILSTVSNANEVILLHEQIEFLSNTGCISGNRTIQFRSDSSYDGMNVIVVNSLKQFVGASPFEGWTLVVDDTGGNANKKSIGNVFSWTITLSTTACSPTMRWMNITADSSANWPSARFGATLVEFEHNIYLFGGFNSSYLQNEDLYVFDTKKLSWKQLIVATSFRLQLDSLNILNNIGASFLLTPWGWMMFGGYSYGLTQDINHYNCDVYILDVLSMQWIALNDSMISPNMKPTGRYYSSVAYLPADKIKRKASYDEIIMFGGSAGATGAFVDGSSGGLLSDIWKLHLYDVSRTKKADQMSYLRQNCQWRQSSFSLACENSTPCDIRDLLVSIWCSTV